MNSKTGPAERVADESAPDLKVFRRTMASIFTLQQLRRTVVGWRRWTVALGIAGVVALVSMIVGGMLTFVPTQGAYTVEVIWWGAPSNWWYYPEILSVQSWGLVQLPFLPTAAMTLVAAGSGMGATAALVSVRGLLRTIGGGDRRPLSAGVAAGFGPGVASLATLGACCCTSCASVGSLAIVAAASGASVGGLLQTEWYLPIFQLGVVYVLLLAQERAVRQAQTVCPDPPPLDYKFVSGVVLRIALLVAGVTWAMAMFVEWGVTDPVTASGATWYHWLFEHQTLSIVAIAAAIFPREFSGAFYGPTRATISKVLRTGLGVAAVTWGIWVPAPLTGIGLGGFLNELFGFLSLPSSWGAVPPDVPIGPALIFHWAFQHLLLSGFALTLAVAPKVATRPLLWTVGSYRGPSVSDSRSYPAMPGREPRGVQAADLRVPRSSSRNPNPPAVIGK